MARNRDRMIRHAREHPVPISAAHRLSKEALLSLERLVAVHTSSTTENPVNEWMTFVALLDAAGYVITPDGIKRT